MNKNFFKMLVMSVVVGLSFSSCHHLCVNLHGHHNHRSYQRAHVYKPVVHHHHHHPGKGVHRRH